MNESTAIGIRLEKDLLRRVEFLGKEEHLDRSTILRILLEEGYEDYIKKKAAKEYKAGKITISGAAAKANITIWEMEQYLVSEGFKSQYSAEDLKKEMKSLRE